MIYIRNYLLLSQATKSVEGAIPGDGGPHGIRQG